MQGKLRYRTVFASLFLAAAVQSVASASELHFGDVRVGESRVLRLYGGLGLSSGNAGGGSCAKGMVTTHIAITGSDAADFQDLGGTYVGLHVPGNRYYEDIRFVPLSTGAKSASFTPESNPVSPLCGLKTRSSALGGQGLPALHKHLLSHIHLRRKSAGAPVSAPTPPAARPDLPPSVGGLAGLSRNVYSGNSSVYGYRFIGSTCTMQRYGCDAVGFIANAYQSNDGSELVIAFRGSASPQASLRDGLYAATTHSGLAVLGRHEQEALVKNMQAAASFVRLINSRYKRATITLTGHSLGGAIAQQVGAASGRSAYAFNAPGSKALFAYLAIPLGDFPTARNRNYQNVNIRVESDQVSKAGMQLGGLVTLAHPQSIALPTSASPANATTCTSYLPTLTTLHAMDTVLSQINHDAPSIDSLRELDFTGVLTTNLWCENPSSLF